MVLVAKQRSDFLRAEYLQDMQIFGGHPEMLIFVDETGKDRRNYMRRFGYSIGGKPPVSKKVLVQGQRVSAIAAMSIIDCHTVFSSVDSDEFMYFLQHVLIAHLQPFNGMNSHSVVVMDNALIHNVHRAVHTHRVYWCTSSIPPTIQP